MVKPGGILIIDHRNYDYILETGQAPQGKNIYYKVVKGPLKCADLIFNKTGSYGETHGVRPPLFKK